MRVLSLLREQYARGTCRQNYGVSPSAEPRHCHQSRRQRTKMEWRERAETAAREGAGDYAKKTRLLLLFRSFPVATLP